ncbi:MAG: winged helix-turn-helix transcriptional regulator [Lachnospiraceae bacterium]|nr:winged helix-turn-helix transcriptional regulator [Lachnospiraceae bacterium]
MGFPETFKALSDPARREILTMLKDGRMPAGDIAEKFDMTAATVSYHLKQLKQAGLVYEAREKNFIYYALNASVFEEIMLWAAQFAGASSPKEENHEEDKTD